MITKIAGFGPIAWIIGNWHFALAIAGALVISHTATYFVGRGHGADSALADIAKAGQKANDVAVASAGKAAAEGEVEQGKIMDDKEKADEAVNLSKDDSSASVASLARMCELVRRSGQDLDGFPACRSGAGETGASSWPE